jgi:adenylosuccinate synthase
MSWKGWTHSGLRGLSSRWQNRERFSRVPTGPDRGRSDLQRLPGFKGAVKGITRYKDLPDAAKKYCRFLEKEVGVPMALISMGRSREETILLDKSFRWIP